MQHVQQRATGTVVLARMGSYSCSYSCFLTCYFRRAEKRCCRAPEGTETEGLWGYNEGSTRGLVGPGYFVCRETGGDERGAIVIDYTLVPGGKCEEWPEIEPNEKGVSRFVYSGMQDFMRPISAHVSIGRAYIKGKESNNYFVLCRESS